MEKRKPNILPGLVSVTFRPLTIQRVTEIASDAGLGAIEWGGDIHVPHGNARAASLARQCCQDAGITISAYGSYYRAGGDLTGLRFETVVETAEALGTRSIRVWAGGIGSAQADAVEFNRIRDDLIEMCRMAQPCQISISLEYHGGTLTDTIESTLELLKAVGEPNLRSYWQPRTGESTQAGVREIRRLLPYLGDLHVFHWWPDHHTRLPLADGGDRWREFLHASAPEGAPRHALLEFVRDDSIEQLLEDAATLRALLGSP